VSKIEKIFVNFGQFQFLTSLVPLPKIEKNTFFSIFGKGNASISLEITSIWFFHCFG
jgi:hypothetical protein